MTSKISFFKLVREDIRNRSWLLAMTALVLFLSQPVALMIQVSNWMEDIRNRYSTMKQVQNLYMGRLGFEAELTVMALMVLAVICAFTGYQYLHSSVKLDFYHSLSIKRSRLFFVQYCSGVIIYIFPAFVCLLLNLAVGGVNGILTGEMVFLALKAFSVHFLYYLLTYATAILAMMMTGKIVVAILALGVFMSYALIISLLSSALTARFFSTALEEGQFMATWTAYLSPAAFCFYVEGKLGGADTSVGSKWLCLGILLALIVALTGLCLSLYSIRRTEAANHSMAFQKTEGVIKVLLAVPISISAGFYVSMMVSAHPTIWLLAGTLFGVLILCALIEFIYHMDIREVFHHKGQIVLSAILAAGVILAFRYDVFGYDTYLPEKEDISAMAIQYDPVNGNYAYKTVMTGNSTSSYYGEKYGLDESAVKDFEPIYELAKEGVGQVKEKNQNGVRIAVKYVLKSGRSVYRAYSLPKETVDQQMAQIYNQEEFKRAVYPILRDTKREPSAFTLTTWNGSSQMILTEEQRKKLIETYRQELLEVTYQDFQADHEIGAFSIEFQNGDSGESYGYGTEDSYPITTDCTETIALIKEYGYEVPLQPDSEQISSINVEIYNSRGMTAQTVSFTDPEEMQEILDTLTYSCFSGFYSLGCEKEDGYSLSLTYDRNSISLWGYFQKGKVPNIVKERLGTPEDLTEESGNAS